MVELQLGFSGAKIQFPALVHYFNTQPKAKLLADAPNLRHMPFQPSTIYIYAQIYGSTSKYCLVAIATLVYLPLISSVFELDGPWI